MTKIPVAAGTVFHDVIFRTGSNARSAKKLANKERFMKPSIPIAVILALTIISATAGDAKALYEKSCSKCHGLDGKGNTKMGRKLGAKDYTDPSVQAALKDEAAIKATREGLKDKDGKDLMKPAEGISDDEIKALVAYMRAFKP